MNNLIFTENMFFSLLLEKAYKEQITVQEAAQQTSNMLFCEDDFKIDSDLTILSSTTIESKITEKI